MRQKEETNVMEKKDIVNRCKWVNLKNPVYIRYHDTEWGVPQHEEAILFEMLFLEWFQAGLSWECLLNKREGFWRAFDSFDAEKISRYGDEEFARLLADPNIIRNKLKIRASVGNSRMFLKIQQQYNTFDTYIWGFTEGKTIVERYDTRTTSPLSDRIAEDLKKRGMKFVGSTVVYSYLQAIGVLNAHGRECDCCARE